MMLGLKVRVFAILTFLFFAKLMSALECSQSLITKISLSHEQLNVLIQFSKMPMAFEEGTEFDKKYLKAVLSGLETQEKADFIDWAETTLDGNNSPALNQWPHSKKIRETWSQISELKRSHKLAVALALENHDKRGQMYAGRSYSYHLRSVRAVLTRFGYGSRDSIFGLKLGTLSWLHDIVEDTPVSVGDIEGIFGKEYAAVIDAVTNEPRETGISQKERKAKTFGKIRKLRLARYLKLADRIANVEESAANHLMGKENKLEKYLAEWPSFEKNLRLPGEAQRMWVHLENMLTDQSYRVSFLASRGRISRF